MNKSISKVACVLIEMPRLPDFESIPVSFADGPSAFGPMRAVADTRRLIASQRKLAEKRGLNADHGLTVLSKYLDEYEEYISALFAAKQDGLLLPEPPAFPTSFEQASSD